MATDKSVGPQPIGLNWGNGVNAQRCAKCRTLCGPEVINQTLGWCEMCLEPVRAAAPELLAALKMAQDLAELRRQLSDFPPLRTNELREKYSALNARIEALHVATLEAREAAIAKAEAR